MANLLFDKKNLFFGTLLYASKRTALSSVVPKIAERLFRHCEPGVAISWFRSGAAPQGHYVPDFSFGFLIASSGSSS